MTRQDLSRFRRKAISVQEAQARIRPFIHPLGTETVSLFDSLERRLAHPVAARQAIPHFRRSGMDGYAVVSASTLNATSESPVELEVIDDIPCGAVPKHDLSPGQAARIMTGAMVPEGADAVIQLEATETVQSGGKAFMRITKAAHSGLNITPIGLELSEGDPILEQGRKIQPGETALLAVFGFDQVEVFRRPVVGVLSTGSELLDVGVALVPGKIRNSNAHMLAAQIRRTGGIPLMLGAIADYKNEAKERILQALGKVDVMITTGGVSVGDHDIMTDIFLDWDGEQLFNKIRMRPGSVSSAGVWREKVLFALSGNPSACFVGFELFAAPMIRGMQGASEPFPVEQTAFMREDFLKANAFQRFVRGRMEIENGTVQVMPVGIDQSSVTTSIAAANCLIVIPPTNKGVEKGELVSIIPLNQGGGR